MKILISNIMLNTVFIAYAAVKNNELFSKDIACSSGHFTNFYSENKSGMQITKRKLHLGL